MSISPEWTPTKSEPEPQHDFFELAKRYRSVRAFTDQIVAPLSAEDCMVQSMEDVSPTRWHLAHTTWFFETFVLKTDPNYQELNPQYNYLFNSYYNSIGKQFPRPQRGFISRPGLDEIKQYRAYVDDEMIKRFSNAEFMRLIASTLEVGLHHEQQHQELMLTDIKHVLSCNPLLPAYDARSFVEPVPPRDRERADRATVILDEGLYPVGFSPKSQNPGQAKAEFCFDNEQPQHLVFLPGCEIDLQLVTCGEYLEFIEDSGYQRPDHWLALGWSTAQEQQWDAPLYWVKQDGVWMQFTLAGLVPVNPDWPVCHVSYFEADAFARWAGRRLPTEFEWETGWRAVESLGESGTAESDGQQVAPFADALVQQGHAIHPTCSPTQWLGSVWQWTASSYQAYPGYRAPEGAIGEYNGKFMCNQYVLRGGSVATSASHIRGTYRNFFPAHTRWQFSGIRLAE